MKTLALGLLLLIVAGCAATTAERGPSCTGQKPMVCTGYPERPLMTDEERLKWAIIMAILI